MKIAELDHHVPALFEDPVAAVGMADLGFEQAGLAEVVELRHPDFPEAEGVPRRNRSLSTVRRWSWLPLAGASSEGPDTPPSTPASKSVPRMIVPLAC